MLRRYSIILNLFLIIAAVFLSERVYNIWTSEASEDLVSLGVQEAQAHARASRPVKARRTLRKAFNVIPEKDLFRPERTEWIAPQEEKSTTPEETTQPTPAKKMRVYGIVIADDFKQAWLLEDGNRRSKPKSYSEGDTLENGWKVASIDPDAVTLSLGSDTVSYPLIEAGNPKPRAAPKAITKTKTKSRKSRVPPSKRSKRTNKRRPSNRTGR